MVLQRKKHPRYRKKKNREENQSLKVAIQVKEKQSLSQMLYSLPLDVKNVIFQMAITSNLYEWSLNHQKKYQGTLRLFDDIHSECQVVDQKGRNKLFWISESSSAENSDLFPSSGLYFKHTPLCQIRVKQSEQNGIKDVFIPHIPPSSQCYHRMWANIDNRYWYHETCRCSTCDMVRIYGYDSLPASTQKKYTGITWNQTDKQWKAKSFKQMKYEKNLRRNEDRRLMKQIKEQSFMEFEYFKYVAEYCSTRFVETDSH